MCGFNTFADKTLNQIQGSSWLSIVTILFIIIGAFKVSLFLFSYIYMIIQLFVLPPVDFKKYGAKKGAWALITGASDGIGKEYAIQLAKKGVNVLLVSRTESKLIELSKEISTKYNVEARYLAMDISADSPENYAKLNQLLQEKDVKGKISILINNVGQSHSIPVPFLETKDQELRNIITINNTATLKITQIVAPEIIASVEAGRKSKTFSKGLILTMGSFGGLIPTPYLATYSGSKAFLQHWSSSLASELAPSHVDVEFVISYLVTSAMSKIRRSSATIPNPKQFVASVLKNIGRECGAQGRYGTSTPFWSHALMHWWIENTVGVYGKLVVGINNTMHRNIRIRALKKAERAKKAL
ncbi:3-ketoacyl-CoA reductase [Nadsonia fulvescens var. elongata DSM 6958]|uniref:Very-long-chain 3-oxoacyl-CoA reductase n=1 Tax=Nadsonia fulvescens var. elongata DSM 6958 TaxID=857566 RepID=A0A1E3PJ45_9ASCO|nr:3-ketoacyl-CoA reductase [Nadsonia fulvescens var. elongata DSM 6958]